jgi:site-specific DNA-methyltransferase (adenine-specific)
MSSHKINHANIKEWAKNYDGELFDGILCDPPYELGFMGKSWDSSGIAFDTDMWADLFRHIKPGGHLLAFSGSRTYHRMAVAIEDAGFEIRDMIEWVYGSGFPKSLNIGKAVDKIQGNEREVTDYVAPDGKKRWGGNSFSVGEEPDGRGINQATKGNSPYEGYGTALKPAHEPCVLARKPLIGTVANNVLKHGTGGLNIDGTRVGMTEQDKTAYIDKQKSFKSTVGNNVYGGNALLNSKTKMQSVEDTIRNVNTGRFPANLIHDGSDEVVAVFPNDNQRFFYCSKASKSERNAGLEGFEERLGGAMSGKEYRDDRPPNHTMRANHHPTVKPLSLTKYLATLIKPPTGGRLLVPFSGSGSEMIGALQAGWEFVEGVELTEEYIPIAEARIKYWTKDPEQRKLL